jgi:hypothetical protein
LVTSRRYGDTGKLFILLWHVVVACNSFFVRIFVCCSWIWFLINRPTLKKRVEQHPSMCCCSQFVKMITLWMCQMWKLCKRAEVNCDKCANGKCQHMVDRCIIYLIWFSFFCLNQNEYLSFFVKKIDNVLWQIKFRRVYWNKRTHLGGA